MDGGGAKNLHARVDPARRGGAHIAWCLPVLLILMAAAISHRMARSADARLESPPPSLLFALSHRPSLAFGFSNFLADVAWLEAVQVGAGRKMSRQDYDRLVELLETVIGFDRCFMVPYLFGGIILGDSADHAPAALSILERGEREFPLEWRIPFYAGYIHYFSLGEAAEGGAALLRAARVPGSPAYFPLLASRMLTEGNRPETALTFLRELVIHEKDPRRLRVLEERVRQVVVERDLRTLEGAVSEYRSRSGELPGKLPDLVASGIIARIPEEPHGGTYVLTSDGNVRSDRAPAGRLKVLRYR
jgi:hypothetical protein